MRPQACLIRVANKKALFATSAPLLEGSSESVEYVEVRTQDGEASLCLGSLRTTDSPGEIPESELPTS